MVIGNIISLTELWRHRLDNLVKRYTDKSKDSLKHSIESLVILLKHSDSQKKEVKKKVNQFVNQSYYFFWSYIKKMWVESLRTHFIYIGISLIVIGAIILILGIWL